MRLVIEGGRAQQQRGALLLRTASPRQDLVGKGKHAQGWERLIGPPTRLESSDLKWRDIFEARLSTLTYSFLSSVAFAGFLLTEKTPAQQALLFIRGGGCPTPFGNAYTAWLLLNTKGYSSTDLAMGFANVGRVPGTRVRSNKRGARCDVPRPPARPPRH